MLTAERLSWCFSALCYGRWHLPGHQIHLVFGAHLGVQRPVVQHLVSPSTHLSSRIGVSGSITSGPCHSPQHSDPFLQDFPLGTLEMGFFATHPKKQNKHLSCCFWHQAKRALAGHCASHCAPPGGLLGCGPRLPGCWDPLWQQEGVKRDCGVLQSGPAAPLLALPNTSLTSSLPWLFD